MRTGQFAQRHHISQSTIGFYLKAGLLTPRLVGGKYDFGPNDDADMELISLLKDWRFSLEEISEILSERRVSRDGVEASDKRLLDMLKRRKEALEREIRQLQASVETLGEKIGSLSDGGADGGIVRESGVDVRFLSLFYCPLCHCQLSVKLDTIENGQFRTGGLTCTCGFRAVVSEGILENPVNMRGMSSDPASNPLPLESPSPEMQNCFYRIYENMADMLESHQIDGKVLIETHTGYASFFLQKARILPESALYICCDPSRAVLEGEKRGMDALPRPLSVLYLASNSQRFPLKDECAHYLVSCFQGMFFTDDTGGFPFHRWTHYLKPGGRIIGAFIDMPSGSKTVRRFLRDHPQAKPEYHNYEAFRKSLTQNGFSLEECREVDSIETSGFPWHESGDRLRFLCYCAQKRSV